MNADKPLLTLAQVRDWQAKAAELVDLIHHKTNELNAIQRRIEAAKAFIASLSDDEQMTTADTSATHLEVVAEHDADKPTGDNSIPVMASGDSVPAAVLAAVAAIGGAPRPKVIRQWIAQNNLPVEAKLKASQAYFYTVLMRHVHGGRLAKRGKGYRLPQSSPKGETGGVAPPADSIA